MTRNDVAIMACISIVIIALFTCVTYVRVASQHSMVEMVTKGANPIAVHCALDGINSINTAVCQVAAGQPLSKSLEK
jgi:hypothetical protein